MVFGVLALVSFFPSSDFIQQRKQRSPVPPGTGFSHHLSVDHLLKLQLVEARARLTIWTSPWSENLLFARLSDSVCFGVSKTIRASLIKFYYYMLGRGPKRVPS